MPLSMKGQGWKNIVVVEGRGWESEEERVWEMVKVGMVFIGGFRVTYVLTTLNEVKKCVKTYKKNV